MSCGSVGWHEQLISLKEEGSANAGAAVPMPARAMTAAVPRTFAIITVLPNVDTASVLAAAAVGPRKVAQLSTVGAELRAVRANACADEVAGMVGIEVSLVDHILGNLGLGFALSEFGAHQMTGGDRRFR